MALLRSLNFYTHEQLGQQTQAKIQQTQLFAVKILTGHDRDVLRSEKPFNICHVDFKATHDIQQWECRATKENEPFGQGVGKLIANGSALSVGDTQSFDVKSEQLIQGAGKYRINLYVKKSGYWYGGNQS